MYCVKKLPKIICTFAFFHRIESFWKRKIIHKSVHSNKKSMQQFCWWNNVNKNTHEKKPNNSFPYHPWHWNETCRNRQNPELSWEFSMNFPLGWIVLRRFVVSFLLEVFCSFLFCLQFFFHILYKNIHCTEIESWIVKFGI